MGILSGIMGHATETSADKVLPIVQPFLRDDEKVARAYQLVRDLFIFTNFRLILIDKMGITGKKQEWMFVPYKSITRFSLETAGHFDHDAELRIWVSGSHEPIKKEFRKDKCVKDICKLLASVT